MVLSSVSQVYHGVFESIMVIFEDRRRRASLSVRYKHYHCNETEGMYNTVLTPLAGSYTEQRVPEVRRVRFEIEDMESKAAVVTLKKTLTHKQSSAKTLSLSI